MTSRYDPISPEPQDEEEALAHEIFKDSALAHGALRLAAQAAGDVATLIDSPEELTGALGMTSTHIMHAAAALNRLAEAANKLEDFAERAAEAAEAAADAGEAALAAQAEGS